MAYASASDVAAITRNILGSASEFDTTTCPTLAQVNVWLTTGCAMIEARIGSRGFGSIPASSAAYPVAQQVNALYAAWLVERTRTSARVTTDERTRADMLKKDYNDMMKELVSLDLSELGVSQSTRVTAGGLTISGKDAMESDSDRVSPRFTRDMFRNDEDLNP